MYSKNDPMMEAVEKQRSIQKQREIDQNKESFRIAITDPNQSRYR